LVPLSGKFGNNLEGFVQQRNKRQEGKKGKKWGEKLKKKLQKYLTAPEGLRRPVCGAKITVSLSRGHLTLQVCFTPCQGHSETAETQYMTTAHTSEIHS
jgi:predicted secreted protein